MYNLSFSSIILSKDEADELKRLICSVEVLLCAFIRRSEQNYGWILEHVEKVGILLCTCQLRM
jgi:hypothetical protein